MAINDCTDYQRFHHDKMNNLVSLTSPFVLFRFVPYRSSAFLVARCNYMNDVLFFLPSHAVVPIVVVIVALFVRSSVCMLAGKGNTRDA